MSLYFRFEKQRILQVTDDFITLDNVAVDGKIALTVNYNVSRERVLALNALKAKVTVFSQLVRPDSVVASTVSLGAYDTSKLIRNVQMQVSDAKNSAREQQGFLLGEAIGDITAKLSNSDLSGARKSFVPRLKIIDTKTLQRENNDSPVLTYVSHPSIDDVRTSASASLAVDRRALMMDCVLNGIDPSRVVSLTHKSLTAHDAIQGTLRRGRAPTVANSSVDQLYNSFIFSSDNVELSQKNSSGEMGGDQRIAVLSVTHSDTITMDTTVVISSEGAQKVDQTNVVYVQVDLMVQDTGEIVDTFQSEVNLTALLNRYHTPKVAPRVDVTYSSDGLYAIINVTSPESVTGFDVYAKVFYPDQDNEYQHVVNIRAKSSVATFNANGVAQQTIAYRFIPIGATGLRGSEYGNVIIAKRNKALTHAATLTLRTIEEGVLVTVNNVHHDAASVQVMVRDQSTFERDYRNVDKPQLIKDQTGVITVIDGLVTSGHSYEYVANVVLTTGTQLKSLKASFKYDKLHVGKISTVISNQEVDGDHVLDFRFDVKSEIIDTSLTIVKNILDRNDVSKFFNDDISKERELLNSLLAHEVQRINLRTGERESFGILSAGSFSDKGLRAKNSVSDLKRNTAYRYEITTLLRSPETMFQELSKAKVDPVTKKQYAFSPIKFHHPVVLDGGVITTTAGRSARYGLDEMQYGTLGVTATIDANFQNVRTAILDAGVSRVGKEHSLLTWRVSGDVTTIDCFLIMKEVNGVRTFVGKAHSLSSDNNGFFFHRLTPRDLGALTYVVVPIFNDYNVGTEAKTNQLIVEVA